MDFLKESSALAPVKAFAGRHRKTIDVALAAVGFRLAVYVISLVILIMFNDFTAPLTFNDFLDAWTRWDSPHYIDIAQYGYAGALENGEPLFLVFYPLLPACLRILHLVFGDYRLCGILLDILCFAVGCVYLHKITEAEYGEAAANNTVLLLSVYPFAFFFGAVLTESLFLAISSAFFYHLRRHNWLAVAFVGTLACLTKAQGVVLALPVAVEIIYSEKGISLLMHREWKEFWRRVILPGCLCALMMSGFLAYLGINYIVSGDPFRFVYYERTHWSMYFSTIWDTLRCITSYLRGGWYSSIGISMWAPDFVLFFVYILFFIQAVRKRMHPTYIACLFVMFFTTYSASWLLSGGRYSLCALPIFMLAGDWTARHPRTRTPLVCVSAMLFAVYLAGFLTGRSIM